MTLIAAVATAWAGTAARAQRGADPGPDHCARYASGESSEAVVRGCYTWFQWTAGGETPTWSFEADPAAPKFLQTAAGAGYKLVVE